MFTYCRGNIILRHVKHFTSTRRLLFLLLTIVIGGFVPHTKCIAEDNSAKDEIGIDEKLGQTIPLDATFINEQGQQVVLKDLVGNKPFLLSLNYYHCPGICDKQLSGIADVLDNVELEPGKDFNVITISFDPTDTPSLAIEKRLTFLAMMKRKVPVTSWHFLTGTKENIAKIVNAVGFQYKKATPGDYYLHSAALMAISPDGKIARYLYGLDYLPFDLQMALTEASHGKTGPTINKVLQYCFSYEPQGRRYAFNIIRIGGICTLIFGLGFLTIVLVMTRKKRKEIEVKKHA